MFDNDITLGSGSDITLLKGIKAPSEIGLLSLFEHYKSCNVGSHLKSPTFPIWLVCSESHFTVLWRQAESDDTRVLELCYYDGLAGKHNHISLCMTWSWPYSSQVGLIWHTLLFFLNLRLIWGNVFALNLRNSSGIGLR